MKCCLCRNVAILTYGFTERNAGEFCNGFKTYYAYGRYNVLLPFCAAHFEEASLTWPGLLAHPIQAVHRYHQEAAAVKEQLRAKLDRQPELKKQVMVAWDRYDAEKRKRPKPAPSPMAKKAAALLAKKAPAGPRRSISSEHSAMLVGFLRGLRAKS